MNETPGTVPARYRVRLVAALGALACLLVLSSGCAASGQSGSVGHSCADRLAKATVTTSPGLWACLDSKLQATLRSFGKTGDAAVVKTPFAVTSRYLGSASDVSTYELTLLPAIAATAGVKTVVLVVWTDSDGRVSNLGVPSPIY